MDTVLSPCRHRVDTVAMQNQEMSHRLSHHYLVTVLLSCPKKDTKRTHQREEVSRKGHRELLVTQNIT